MHHNGLIKTKILYSHSFQILEDVIVRIDSWQNQRDEKLSKVYVVMELELSAEKSRQKAMHESTEGTKGRFKLDEEKMKFIKVKYSDELKQIRETFLSDSNAKGLRLTCRSTIDLPKHLLLNCGFQFVLTRKLNQDWLEVSLKIYLIII